LPASRFVHAVLPPCVQPCATRAAIPHGSHRFDQVIHRGLSFARRSATRMPNLHTTGPDQLCAVLRRCAFDPATLVGLLHPSQFSSRAGPGVCESLRHLCVRDSPPFIPTCRYPMQSAPLNFTVAGTRILNSFQASLWKANRLRIDSTGFWVVYRERAEPGMSWRPARPILPWVSGSSLGLAGCFSKHAIARRVSRANHHQPQPSFFGCHPLMGIACDSERTCRRNRSRSLWGEKPECVRDHRFESEATSLPSQALQRFEADDAWPIRANRSSSIGNRERASVSDRLPV